MSLASRVSAALARINNPRIENDLLSGGMIRDIVADDSTGKVAFTFLLGREDPATLVRETRATVRAIEGVTEVKISVVDPAGPQAATHGPPSPGQTHGAAGTVPPPPTPVELPELGRILAISSGKGGVGKSTVAVNLAVALAQAGHRVGVMDADVYGPNVPRMFGVFEKPPVIGGKIQPLEVHGVKLMSLGFLVERDAPAIWRGPIIMKIVHQFLRDVQWGQLDYFIVDLPPGTGDAQLSLVQACHVAGAIIVTTPQEMAVGDALRGAKMFERVNVPVIGIIENMSGFICSSCGTRHELFSTGGGERLSEEVGAPLLGKVPLQSKLADEADAGRPVVLSQPESPAARALTAIAEDLPARLGSRATALPILRG